MGSLRITAPLSMAYLLNPLVPAFREAYPDVTLEISLDEALADLVADGYDAAIGACWLTAPSRASGWHL